MLDPKNDLMKLIENHGNQPFYIFRYLSLVKNFLIVSKTLKYTIEVLSRRQYHFLDDLKKKMFYTSDQMENREGAAGKQIFR